MHDNKCLANGTLQRWEHDNDVFMSERAGNPCDSRRKLLGCEYARTVLLYADNTILLSENPNDLQ